MMNQLELPSLTYLTLGLVHEIQCGTTNVPGPQAHEILYLRCQYGYPYLLYSFQPLDEGQEVK